jgi:hypothetical protein
MAITSSAPLTPSDTNVTFFSWLLVTGTAGTVVYEQAGGNVITLPAVPIGVWMPAGNAIRIRTASAAVGFIVA